MTDQRRERWEYCEIRQDIAQGIMHGQAILFYHTGGGTTEERFLNRESAIAQLGIEGWEMVGVSGGFSDNSSGFRVFFKRRLLDEDDDS